MGKAINERKTLIEQCAGMLALTAIKEREPWVQQLGDSAGDRGHRLRQVIILAAYRDRYGVTSRDPLGDQPADDNQCLDRARVETALAQLRGLESQRRRSAVFGLEPVLGL